MLWLLLIGKLMAVLETLGKTDIIAFVVGLIETFVVGGRRGLLPDRSASAPNVCLPAAERRCAPALFPLR